MPLEMGEIWALKPALQTEILSRLDGGPPAAWPELIDQLAAHRRDRLEGALRGGQPGPPRPGRGSRLGAYSRMDFESRDRYRKVVGELGQAQPGTASREVAAAAVALARDAASHRTDRGAAVRRAHVGYYLIDSGLPHLRERVGHRPPAASSACRDLTAAPPDGVLSGRHRDPDVSDRRGDASRASGR